jgi:hypothetical protein
MKTRERRMPTDWNLIREMMAAVIDTEPDRDLTVDVSGQKVSIHEFIVGAGTLPENLRYRIIRERHDKGIDLPYTPEAARIIIHMAEACSELIGAGEAKPAEAEARAAIQWYRAHTVPRVKQAIGMARSWT